MVVLVELEEDSRAPRDMDCGLEQQRVGNEASGRASRSIGGGTRVVGTLENLSEADPSVEQRLNGYFGTFLMVVGSLLAILIFSDRTGMTLVDLPAVWYQTRSFHIAACVAIFVAAAVMLKIPQAPDSSPELRKPLFDSVRLLTRANCPLCDKALQELERVQQWLPRLEIVDVDTDASLSRQFGQSVPVVEFDGKIRFRGAIDRQLLLRLLRATQLQQAGAPPASERARLTSSESPAG